MAVCAACGAENRDKAKFCKGCAQALVPLAAPAAVPAPASRGLACPACHALNRRSATVCKSCEASLSPSLPGTSASTGVVVARRRWGWGWIIGPALLVAFGAAWWVQAQHPAAPYVPVGAPVVAQPELTAGQRVQVTTTVALPVPAVAEALLPSEVPPRPVPVKKEPKSAKASNPRGSAQAERQSPPATPQPEPAATQADGLPRPSGSGESDRVPAATASVDQQCADRSNFIARDICRIRACNDAARAADPVCVRFRQMEEANRQRQQN